MKGAIKMENYRFNLKLSSFIKEYLKEMAWQNRTTITGYLTNLIQEDMKKNIKITEKLKEKK